MVMVHPQEKASVEWVANGDTLTRVWRGKDNYGDMNESRSPDTEKGQRQEIAALFDMGWHQKAA